MHEIIKTDI